MSEPSTHAVRSEPNVGRSTQPVATEPTAAPSVLTVYTLAQAMVPW